MRDIKLLPRKEIKELKEYIKTQWGAEMHFEHAILQNSEEDLFIANKEIFSLDFDQLRIDSFGLYIGQYRKSQPRQSIEGWQFIGPLATKNVVEISFQEMRLFFHGEEIPREAVDAEGYLILRHQSDFIGCSRFKDGKLLNFVPKVRRIKTPD